MPQQVFRVDSVNEAVHLAEGLRQTRKYDWFRGQTVAWPPLPTIIRRTQEQQKEALDRLDRFDRWCRMSPILSKMAEDIDAVTAIAQHYGLDTPMMDFTTEPAVAGFFASYGDPATIRDEQAQASRDSCIIMLNTADFAPWCKPIAEAVGQRSAPRMVNIDVTDLWRLQAQRGVFLYCPTGNLERVYGFSRISFPYTGLVKQPLPSYIYPERKSSLEQAIDSYFHHEIVTAGDELVLEAIRPFLFRTAATAASGGEPEGIIHFGEPGGGICQDVFRRPNGTPPAAGWSTANLAPWIDLPDEHIDEVWGGPSFVVDLSPGDSSATIAAESADQIAAFLAGNPGCRQRLVEWKLAGSERFPQDRVDQIQTALKRAWDGLRRLPYTDDAVTRSLANCILWGLAVAPEAARLMADPEWASGILAEPVCVEFGAVGSHSRGIASSASLIRAVRPDLRDILRSDLVENAVDLEFLLSNLYEPRYLFPFDELASISTLPL
jgi:hypothetical protein